jgi:hypothetical protein
MKLPKNSSRDQLKKRSEMVTRARQDNAVMEEKIRTMKLDMEYPIIEARYIKFYVRRDFVRKFIKPTPWPFRWIRWIQYGIVVYWLRKNFTKELRG